MANNNTQAYIILGRWLLGLYFLLPGIGKFAAWDKTIAMMEVHNIPYAAMLMAIAGVAQIIGALLLMSNRYVRFASLGFVLYIVLINLMMHDFWNFADLVRAHETQNFFKNLGILAGLLVLAGFSVKRPLSLGGLAKSDKIF